MDKVGIRSPDRRTVFLIKKLKKFCRKNLKKKFIKFRADGLTSGMGGWVV